MNAKSDLEVWIDHAEDDFNDLITVNNLLEQAGIKMNVSENDLALLSSYAVRARYSGERPEVEDAKETLKIARIIRKFSRTFLGLK